MGDLGPPTRRISATFPAQGTVLGEVVQEAKERFDKFVEKSIAGEADSSEGGRIISG